MRYRAAIAAALLGLCVQAGAALAQPSVPLPAPRMQGGMPVLEALSKRQSQRAFNDRALAAETLSTLLWAAFGINRPEQGERTAPSWRGSKAIDIFVATAEGTSLYDPRAHALRRVREGDIRAETGRQPFAATAPVVLIYVADRTRMPEAPPAEQVLYAHVDAAMIAQNVYLFAASEGLGTVLLGNVEKAPLAQKLNLGEMQVLAFTQPVGHPR